MSRKKRVGNCECGEPATWVRRTQFAGDHPFCEKHARNQENFGKSNPGYFFWEQLPPPKHPKTLKGFKGSLFELAEHLHRMRYDAVMEFYQHSAAELRRQASGDEMRGRPQLAALLTEAAEIAEEQRAQFERLWNLCWPHLSGK